MIEVQSIELRLVSLPLRRPFRTSFGEEATKEAILVRVETADGAGWGECAASAVPRYSEEFNASAWLVPRRVCSRNIPKSMGPLSWTACYRGRRAETIPGASVRGSGCIPAGSAAGLGAGLTGREPGCEEGYSIRRASSAGSRASSPYSLPLDGGEG